MTRQRRSVAVDTADSFHKASGFLHVHNPRCLRFGLEVVWFSVDKIECCMIVLPMVLTNRFIVIFFECV